MWRQYIFTIVNYSHSKQSYTDKRHTPYSAMHDLVQCSKQPFRCTTLGWAPPILIANIRLGWRGLIRTITLAYYKKS